MMTATTVHGSLLAHDPSAWALWEKLRGLSFDRGSGPNTFAARLASEQGWSAEFTGRVIEEYRRFLLLFALEQRREKAPLGSSENAPAVRIVPSAVVDKVWHLHLLYTQSYWGTLCQDILGASLHHQPADGSPGEAGTLDEVYRANMEAYRTTFGELAPGDIWPAPPGTPPPGLPLDAVLDRTSGPSKHQKRYLLFGGILVAMAILILSGKARSLNTDELAGAMALTGGVVIAMGACICLFVAMVLDGKNRAAAGL